MTAQLDESAPARLARALAAEGCRALHFPNDWKGLKNGELMVQLRHQGVNCLITCDKNLRFQQSIAQSGLALVVLPRQRFGDLAPLCRAIAQAVSEALPGETVLVHPDGNISKE